MEPGIDSRISPRTLDILDVRERCRLPWEENMKSAHRLLQYNSGKGRKSG